MPEKTASQNVLHIESLVIRRGHTQILRGIDWKIETGEQWAILGANGCGKTSLLSAITGYLMPSSGSIHFLRQRYGSCDWQSVRQRIGYVSNALTRRIPAGEPALETVLSGATAQLGYWAREAGDEAKALRCLAKLGVRKLATRPWGILSQGERQKVSIARALMADPKLLILDEPCSGLDPVARENFLQSLSKLTSVKRPISTVMVTHHIEEIIPEISHVLLLHKGRVLAAGPKTKVLSSANLSKAFGAAVTVRHRRSLNRWELSFPK